MPHNYAGPLFHETRGIPLRGKAASWARRLGSPVSERDRWGVAADNLMGIGLLGVGDANRPATAGDHQFTDRVTREAMARDAAAEIMAVAAPGASIGISWSRTLDLAAGHVTHLPA